MALVACPLLITVVSLFMSIGLPRQSHRYHRCIIRSKYICMTLECWSSTALIWTHVVTCSHSRRITTVAMAALGQPCRSFRAPISAWECDCSTVDDKSSELLCSLEACQCWGSETKVKVARPPEHVQCEVWVNTNLGEHETSTEHGGWFACARPSLPQRLGAKLAPKKIYT